MDFSQQSGLPMSLSELNALFIRVDVDGSGEIDFEEFEELLLQQLGAQVNSVDDIPSCAYPAIAENLLIMLEKHVPRFTLELRLAWQTLIDRAINVGWFPPPEAVPVPCGITRCVIFI
ncbi:MAG TPA: EF-hand domain-containing protein [Allocoleopsis sp.]